MGCFSDKVLENNESNDNENEFNNENEFSNSDPSEMKFYKYLSKDSYTSNCCDNIFTVLTSINYIPYLIYTNKNYSILFYNLKIDKIEKEIPKAHGRWEISNFSYFFDKINNRDLLISVSGVSNTIKIWDLQNYESIVNIEDNVKNGLINSATIINDNNKFFIIIDNIGSDPIKIYDFKFFRFNLEKNFFNYKRVW